MGRVMPSITLAVFAVVAVMPMGFAGGELLWQALPLFAAIFFWASCDDAVISARSVFLTGLAVDILGGGGLMGLWALLALAVYGCALVMRTIAGQSRLMQWAAFCVAMVIVNGLHFGIAVGLGGGHVAPQEFAIAVLAGAAIYPLVALALAGIDAVRAGRLAQRVI